MFYHMLKFQPGYHLCQNQYTIMVILVVNSIKIIMTNLSTTINKSFAYLIYTFLNNIRLQTLKQFLLLSYFIFSNMWYQTLSHY